MVTMQVDGSEDCLTLNVYTPSPLAHPRRPVMVWIHGGGFVAGSGKTDLYGPDYLISEDVVVVTINYRLGVFGFLALEDPSLGVPGNAGLKDQVMALKWVQKNIRYFGGDPNNVTIFGESAGAASCHFLMLSPMARGLFHRCIAQSGSALNLWAFGQYQAKELAEKMGFKNNNEAEILSFLRQADTATLFSGQLKFSDVSITRLLKM